METTIVYLVAGLSKRFGGNPKQLVKVGPNNETLIECSVNQAVEAGFNKIIFITGEKTHDPIKNIFKDSYKGASIVYTKQQFNPEERDNPWGTVDALCTATKELSKPFAVLNGDDLYGTESIRKIREFLTNNPEKNIAIGYKLLDIIPKTGEVNRGIFEIENNRVKSIKEEMGISYDNYKQKGLSENTLCSMNLFGLTPFVLEKLNQNLTKFKKENKGNRKIECLLPTELNKLIKEGVVMELSASTSKWVGVTQPGDEETVREYLKNQ